MDFLEKDLEEILKTTPTYKLADAGLEFFYECSKILTQVKIGNYGVADMIAYSREKGIIKIYVIELKKEKIGISAFLQAVRYARGIQRYFIKRDYVPDEGLNLVKCGKNSHIQIHINIVLIGRTIDIEGSFCYLPDMADYFQFYTYNYDFDGIKFKDECRYNLTEEGF